VVYGKADAIVVTKGSMNITNVNHPIGDMTIEPTENDIKRVMAYYDIDREIALEYLSEHSIEELVPNQ